MIQSIVVKKSHPDVRNLRDAIRVARQYGATIGDALETDTSYRFRQVEPSLLDRHSYKTDAVDKNVSIITGELKR